MRETNNFKKLSLEEIVLFTLAFVFALTTLIFALFLNKQISLKELFLTGLKVFQNKTVLWGAEFSFLLLVIIFYWFIKTTLKNQEINIKKSLQGLIRILEGMFLPLRFVAILALFTTSSLTLLGLITNIKKGHLKNELILHWEKIIFKTYPFLWIHSQANPLKTLLDTFSPLIIFSFFSLAVVMIFTGLLFYFLKRRIFSAYIIAIALTILLSFPFWYLVPVNSPNNFYLSKNIPPSYKAPQKVIQIEKDFRNQQKELPPISTFPSMHVAWAIIVLYYLKKFKKETAILTIFWLILLSIGTIYLAQHYFLDILLSFPIAALSITLANFIVKKYERLLFSDPASYLDLYIQKETQEIYKLLKDFFT